MPPFSPPTSSSSSPARACEMTADRPVGRRLRILLSAYACEPDQGSEPGIGWHWAIELARLGHEVTVLTQTKNRASIEHALARMTDPPAGLTFVYHHPPAAIRRLKQRAPAQIYHLVWQWYAWRFMRDRRHQGVFDLVQHLTFGTLRQPSFLGRLGLPFVIGPVGGGERAPLALRRGYGLRGWLLDGLRDLANLLVPLDPLSRAAFTQAFVIYAKTEETRLAVPRRWRGKVAVRLELGIDRVEERPGPERPAGAPLRLLFAGRFIHWKGMHLGLRALAAHLESGGAARLTMLGRGPQERRLRRQAQDLGIDAAIDWVPWVAHEEMGALYRAHDALLFPSLHDSSGNVVIEAMAHGLPVICFDLGGPVMMVDSSCGRVVATSGCDARSCAHAMARAIGELEASSELRGRLAEGALARARHHLWPLVVGRLVIVRLCCFSFFSFFVCSFPRSINVRHVHCRPRSWGTERRYPVTQFV